MAFFFIFYPVVMAALAALIPSDRWRPWLLPLAGTLHAVLTGCVLARQDPLSETAWLALDPLGKVILLVVSLLFLFCSYYAAGYLRLRGERPNRVFCVCLLAFLGVASLAAWSRHLGLQWVAIEATTLVTAPLIFFNRTQRSVEATWKYMVVCSVGIALALLGTFFLAYSALHAEHEASLMVHDLVQHAPKLSKPWLHAAFVLLLVGYGTKMGLAPMHTWKPDAYGEAPGVIGAILAGGVTSCAFLALLRAYHICVAAGEAPFVSRLLVFMGLFSMAVAGLFMVGQRDMKRMLAYSSVEHMGFLVLGLGLGAPALFGTLLHVVNNGLTKGILFLSAGNIHRAYNSKSTEQVSGAMRRLPLSGTLFLTGFLAITGSPPFGPFISEFMILNGAFAAGHAVVGALFLVLLLVVFIGMGAAVLKVVQGRPSSAARGTSYRDSLLTGAPMLGLLAVVVLIGVVLPAPLAALITDAVHFLEGQP
ncbi:MAG TPA: proton-conducting transporter membrane subunit [Kiritimatiellia bacterium]|nr:proton-conducting transporter membrane subunit [Kiritimatiellia bacterium]HRU69850.1 proton-conducting transporter membrane subunit [Kiritimatiellia bacterium]